MKVLKGRIHFDSDEATLCKIYLKTWGKLKTTK